MRIVAIIAARNEELYLEKCIRHFNMQGVSVCIIDDGSTDRTRDIAAAFLGKGVCRIVERQSDGYCDLFSLLRLKEKLSLEIDADWFIHNDADEIREAPKPYRTLREAIGAVDAAGYNAINFDEFVFVPETYTVSYEGADYIQRMRYYYFFSPSPLRNIKAWKKADDIDLASSAGHQLTFSNRQIFPRNFILRHYIFLSISHARSKYGFQRKYLPSAITDRGWHRWRARLKPEMIKLPSIADLKEYSGDGFWDYSDPKQHHLFGPTEP